MSFNSTFPGFKRAQTKWPETVSFLFYRNLTKLDCMQLVKSLLQAVRCVYSSNYTHVHLNLACISMVKKRSVVLVLNKAVLALCIQHFPC